MSKDITIELNRDMLAKALSLVTAPVETRNTIAILAYVALRAKGKTVTIEGTDLDVTVECELPRIGQSKAAAAITIPAKQFLAMVKASVVETTKILVQETGVSINGSKLPTLPIADYPANREIKSSVQFSMSGAELGRLLTEVRPAVSDEETRYYLQGIFFEPVDKDKIRFVATDGHRMNFVEFPCEGASHKSAKIIVPAKTVDIIGKIAKAAGKSPHPINIAFGDGLLEASLLAEFKNTPEDMERAKQAIGAEAVTKAFSEGGGGIDEIKENIAKVGATPPARDTSGIIVTADIGFPVTLRSKRIDGSFPDYRRVIPQGNDKVACLQTDHLLSAVKNIAAAMPDKAGRGVKFSFTPTSLMLSWRDGDGETVVTQTLECGYTGTPMDIGFNYRYIIDALRDMADVVVFKLSDPNSPTIIQSEQGPFIVLMPMRVA